MFGGQVGHGRVHVHGAHGVADDFGLLTHRQVGLVVFIGALTVTFGRLAPRLAFDIEVVRAGPTFVDEIGRQVEVFAQLRGVVELDQRQFNFLMAAIAALLAGVRAEDRTDMVHVAHHHLHHPVAPSGVEIGDRAFQHVACVVHLVIVAQVGPAVLRLALQIPAVEVTVGGLRLFQIIDDGFDLRFNDRIAAVRQSVAGSLDPFANVAVPENLRGEVGNKATVLGFVGLPYTLATYMVEGGSSKEYKEIKALGYESPQILHAMLDKLADNIGDYAIYQIENGAQVIQVFDSWAGNLAPLDYDNFAAPYQRKVIDKIKKAHPEVPIIIYINKSGALLERMATSGADIISLDWTVTISEARKRIGDKVGIQGNLDPMILFGPDATIKERAEEILTACGGRNHVMNLGHGIDATTPEEKAKFFVDVVQKWRA